jgi:uncharacterized DUF497 family protein
LAYACCTGFQWNENKRRTNLLKHRVDFADAVGVFYDDHAITIIDVDHHREQRMITLGIEFRQQTLVVVNVQIKGDTIRLISARKANRQERK